MNCEICGREIKGRGFKVIVEGSEVTVCAQCKQFGSEVPRKRDQKERKITKKKTTKRIEFQDELIEDYHLIIRREREKRGWSQEKLAKKIQEKESLIKKIENKEIFPEPKVIEKFEKLFNVKLREQVPEIRVVQPKSISKPTLGDIVVLKRRRK
ncbi:TIGR00270 family protein [Archaeoglobales archaeon]|nr:MAG: TIGR00270 family protein [Archaeoglobales archaeon]